MAENKISVLLIALLLLAGLSSALSYKVEVSKSRNFSAKNLRFNESIDSAQRIELNVQNIGSVGCEYRMKGVYSGENFSDTSYSRSYSIWPGESADMQMIYVPLNYTGNINATLKIQYCGKESEVGRFRFEDSSRTIIKEKYKSETIDVSEKSLKFKTAIDSAIVVPYNVPAFWKASSSTLINGKSVASFEPTIFDERENIGYILLNKSTYDVIGSVDVDLTEDKTIIDILEQNYLLIAFGISLLVNTGLLSRYLRDYLK